eukprot:scaffold669_cov379-Prasinococcus_capsulatus_cf.AAC.4
MQQAAAAAARPRAGSGAARRMPREMVWVFAWYRMARSQAGNWMRSSPCGSSLAGGSRRGAPPRAPRARTVEPRSSKRAASQNRLKRAEKPRFLRPRPLGPSVGRRPNRSQESCPLHDDDPAHIESLGLHSDEDSHGPSAPPPGLPRRPPLGHATVQGQLAGTTSPGRSVPAGGATHMCRARGRGEAARGNWEGAPRRAASRRGESVPARPRVGCPRRTSINPPVWKFRSELLPPSVGVYLTWALFVVSRQRPPCAERGTAASAIYVVPTLASLANRALAVVTHGKQHEQ